MASTAQLLQLVQKATRTLASSGNFDLLLRDVLAICVDAVGANGGTVYIHDADAKRLRFQHVIPAEVEDKLPVKDMADDFGMAGNAFQSRQTLMREFPEKPQSEWNHFEQMTGVQLRTMIAVPLMLEDEQPIGVVQLINKKEGTFDNTDQAVLDIIAAVSTMGYLNARLTEESTRASTLLGMGKVSHDIGNLAASLYATLSYSEMPVQGLKEAVHARDMNAGDMYVDMLGDMLGDLRKSVDRIVGYSRLISDLSAGRTLRPSMEVSSMAETIENAAAYLESEGRANHIALRYEIVKDAPATAHDDLYVFRIVQNLVGNAIKAVRETLSDEKLRNAEEGDVLGEVCIRYRFENSLHYVEVHDSGPGMSAEIANKILSGNAHSQWEKGGGSGWGTKIVLELAASHQAKVEIESEIGHGATFRVVFPQRDVL